MSSNGTDEQGLLGSAVITITTDGRKYDIRIGDFSAMDEGDFKKVTGRSIMSVFVDGDVDSMTIAGLVWLVRRRYEKKLSFQAVAARFKLSDLDTLDMPGAGGDDEDEASAMEGVAGPES